MPLTMRYQLNETVSINTYDYLNYMHCNYTIIDARNDSFPKPCLFCSYYSQTESIAKHYYMHNRSFECYECGTFLNSLNILKIHLEKHKNRLFRCDLYECKNCGFLQTSAIHASKHYEL